MASKGMVVAFVGLVWLTPCGAAHASGGEASPADARRAQEAVHQAEDAVRRAQEQRALWTTAQEALERARAAAARGDYPAAIAAARFATQQARLGMEQTRYPRFTE
jgi:hypothetical protein